MKGDPAAISALRQLLTAIALHLGRLPNPSLNHLEEWKQQSTPIIQTSQSVALSLRDIAPETAQLLDEVAEECDVMIAAIERDREAPPMAVAHRRRRITELEGSLLEAAKKLT